MKNMKKYEKKFLVNKIPDIKCLQPIIYERYFTYIGKQGQVRVQRRGEKFEIESVFGTYKKKILITKDAFQELTKDCDKLIKRENYLLSDNVKLKIYKGQYEGLCIVDVECKDYEDYCRFRKPDWLGAEITSTLLGKDGSIIQLSREEVFQTIKGIQKRESLHFEMSE